MKSYRAVIAFVIVGALIANCAVSSASPSREAAVNTAGAASAAFPVEVTSGSGTVKIASRPDRILCLSPSATQMLYEIGAGPQVVGVDKYSTWPANAPRTKFTGYETSAEDYLPLKPDLVILAYQSGTLVQQLQKLDIPVLILPPASTIANVNSQLEELGAATGNERGAKNVVSSFATDITTEVRAAGGHGRGATYYVELDPTSYYTATSGTFIGAEFSLFGMRDIANAASHGSQYPQVSPEYILKENPDYVFLADTICCGVNATNFAHRPGFSVLRAVQLHHVVPVNDSVASQWGPHTMEAFVSLLAQALRTISLAPVTLAAAQKPAVDNKAPTETRAPVLFDTDEAVSPTVYPTRLRLGHVLIGVGFLLAAATASILIGPADLPAGDVIKYVLSKIPFVHIHSGLSQTGAIVVWQLRMPRMVLGGIVGAMLAVAGASYQGVFSNPLADPYLLGIASGAGVGATVVLVDGPYLGHLPTSALPPAAFIGGVVAVGATFALGRARASDRSAASMLLAGVAVSAFFVAVQTFLMQQSNPGDLTLVYGWILGGLSTAGWSQVGLVLPYVAVAACVLFSCRRLLDVLTIGDEEATSVGVKASRVRLIVIVAATLGTAAAVSVSGLIGFVGIIVPHTIRLVAGPSYRRIIPLSLLFGAGFLILADILARTILSPGEVPLGVVTAFLGAPFFLIVLRQAKRLG